MRDRYEGLRHTQIVDHSVPCWNHDAPDGQFGPALLNAISVAPDVYDEPIAPDPMSLASDGFRVLLDKLHCGSVDTKRFATAGYAAIWHMNPAAIGGLSQKQVAAKIGVRPETFTRAVKAWALEFGLIGPGMRPRAATKARVRRGSNFSKVLP